MTAEELFDIVLSLMYCPTGEGGEYEQGFLALLNQRLAETYAVNDDLREFRGKEPIGGPRKVSEMSDEIDYEQELLNALPYGIAATLFAEDDLTGMSNVYRSDYEGMLTDCVRAFIEKEE